MRDGRVLLIANPAAQQGNGAHAAQIAYELLTQWLGEGAVDFALTEQPGHGVELAERATAQKYGTVIALGGDGLVHEVVNGLARLPRAQRPCFGLIPVGSGNDYARTLGMDFCVPDAIVQFLDARVEAFDLGCCNGVYFAETLSFGLDAAIALDTMDRRRRSSQQGTALFLASGLDQLLHHRDTFQVKAVLDGDRVIEAPIHLFAVQIGPAYGGGFRICPEADPTDGLFDICYADAPMGLVPATYRFLRAKEGHHTKFKRLHFDRASRIELSFTPDPPCQIDGEPLPAPRYSITTEHHGLDVLTAVS